MKKIDLEKKVMSMHPSSWKEGGNDDYIDFGYCRHWIQYSTSFGLLYNILILSYSGSSGGNDGFGGFIGGSDTSYSIAVVRKIDKKKILHEYISNEFYNALENKIEKSQKSRDKREKQKVKKLLGIK